MTGTDLLSFYSEELRQIPALGAEEEGVLLEKLWAGDMCTRERLVEGYLDITLTEIQSFVGSMGTSELIGAADLALTATFYDEKILESTMLRSMIK